MRILPHTLRYEGITYVQFMQCGQFFIYRQLINPKVEYFLVFKLRSCPGSIECSITNPVRDILPKDEDIGMSSYLYKTPGNALNRLFSLKGHLKTRYNGN